ncbi:hypothetical protein [Nocardioides sp.]|uniref:hypothetical protein n=1 Tax=Nocardioides sp. TaxID=35761 RepID=UPI001E08ECD7|nr:hypothetical protein [Nocardioides sp.]MBU1803004.1 hypothetical protein [Actinomycetota bacterium]
MGAPTVTTVFDPSAVHRLEADTQSEPFVRTLVGTYQRMLAPRVDRLVDAVLASDAEQALDAALSLKVSSIMTGATELAEIATFVVDDLRNNDLPSARSQALLLPGAALRARAALDVYFGPPDRESEPVAQESTDSIR